MRCLFVSDLHGREDRYRKLFDAVRDERPGAVLLGGDLLPSGGLPTAAPDGTHRDFLNDFLAPELERLRRDLGADAPRVPAILGNDDPRFEEAAVLGLAARGLLEYVHDRSVPLGGYVLYGYAFAPPSPFPSKDWERYDVSRYVDPGCVPPEEGTRTVPVSASWARYGTIGEDLESLLGSGDPAGALFLFHAPPYGTALDRAALDGRSVDHVPVDVHVGSVAIRRFIEKHQPRLALCGHVHESPRLTGSWRDRIGDTPCLSAAHDGPELALVRFDPDDPDAAERELR
jgi:Icc-related predicted phosphoesterase